MSNLVMPSPIERLTFSKCKGEVIDKYIHKDGTVEVFEGHNIIVDKIFTLMACLLKSPSSASALYWANGIGDASWDATPYEENSGVSSLVNEIFRKQISASDISFITEAGVVTAGLTNRLQITTLFNYAESNGDLREFALFGYNASATANSGIMINHKVHGRRSKDSEIQLERIIKLTIA